MSSLTVDHGPEFEVRPRVVLAGQYALLWRSKPSVRTLAQTGKFWARVEGAGEPRMTEPAYKQVADELRVKIRTGKLQAETRLPSLAQLGQQYGVSGDVARQAIGILRAEGLVETRQGSGTFVRAFAHITRNSPGRLSRAHWGRGKAIQDYDTGQRVRTVDIVVSQITPPTDVAEALQIKPGGLAISRARRFIVNERPIQLATSYYPLELVRDTAITSTDTGPGGSYARLTELGLPPARFTESVSARIAQPDEAFDLALPADNSFVFDMTRWAYTAEDRCIEVNRMVLDAAAYTLEYHFTA